MHLERVAAENFRNLAGSASFARGLNILIGENGQGKTNWLEAIYLLSSGTSFRTAKRVESIAFGEATSTIDGTIASSENITRTLTAKISADRRTLLVNEKKATTAEFIGNLYCIVFNAGEMDIVRGHPESRRRFLDDSIAALHPPFTRTAADYNRVIKQKNALLQRAAEGGITSDAASASLDAWNDELARLSRNIHNARIRLIERLSGSMHDRLFTREQIEVRYVSSFAEHGDLSDYESLVRDRLAIRKQAELAAGRSLIGPHRDDLEILFDGVDIRKYGSAGQQRSALLQIMLAGMNVYQSTTGDFPVFLIDDIDAELDYRRIGNLLDHLSDKCQTIVTTSKESFVERFGSTGRTLFVENGRNVERRASTAGRDRTLGKTRDITTS